MNQFFKKTFSATDRDATYIKKIAADITDIFIQSKKWFLSLTRTKKIIVIIVLLLITVTILRALLRDTVVTDNKKLPRAVTLSSVSDLSANSASIPLLGTVTSRNEATVRAETGGGLRVVYKKLGDYVPAGGIIAEFENRSERAQVTAAEGGYEQAKAARDIARITSNSSNTSLTEAKTGALNTMNAVYSSFDDAVRVKSDLVLTNADNSRAEFLPLVPDQALTIKIARERVALQTLLSNRSEKNKNITIASDLVTELTTLESEAKQIKTYLDDVSFALSKTIPDSTFNQSSLDGAKISITAARGEIAGTLTTVAGARSTLNGSIASSQIAETNYSNANPDNASADAHVKQALGSYQAALANLEKTIVRSPISGTLNSLSVATGDYIAPFTEIGVISNNGALEVVAYSTEEDAKQLAVGAKVSIEEKATGVITKVAGALDPRTRKIEVRIGITKGTESLVNGQSVRITVARPNAQVQSQIPRGIIEIPISALKITPQGSFIFTIEESTTSPTEGRLVAHKVTEGAILGEKIQILEGLHQEMTIVTDVRGLKDGGIVTINQ